MENKKNIVITVLAIVAMIVVVSGATYAYFQAQTGTGATTPINVTTETTDSLTFAVGDALTVSANQVNFAEGLGNQSDSTTATANLIAGGSSTATYTYNVYLDILDNPFVYSDGATAELLLQVFKPDGTEVTTLDEVQYKTITTTTGSVSGFDITEYDRIIKIVEGEEITSSDDLVSETWSVTVTFVNLDSDQEVNTNKVFSADLLIQSETEVRNYLTDTIIAQYTGDGENGLYYHDAVGTYTNATLEATDNSYRYAGADPNNYVCFGSTADVCPTDNLYRIIGVFGDQVKLIKYDYATTTALGTATAYWNDSTPSASYYKGQLSAITTHFWSGSSINPVNTWSSSTLNTSALNSTYISYLGSVWSSLIATTIWKVGGNTTSNMTLAGNAKTGYTNEIVSPAETTTYSDEIGLMYVSDYYYAADPTYWSYKGMGLSTTDYRVAAGVNWMHMGFHEWTISRMSGNTSSAFLVHSAGNVDYSNVYYYGITARPVFYLKSSVEYDGGQGTSSEPYRVVVS